MTVTDRLNGVNSGLAYKAPVRAATTANITLSGEQTIAGVAVVADDAVLVKDQNTASENGIYLASTSTWTRRTDFDGNRDIVKGTRVRVTDGSNAGVYEVTSSNPITIGSSSISFSAVEEGLDVSAFMLTLLDDDDAEDARTTLSAQRQQVTDPRDSAYGVTFDGATDDTAAWNLLIAAINAGTVKTVLCPSGTSLISAKLTTITASNWAIVAHGFACTTLKMSAGAGTAGTFLQIGSSGTEAQRWTIAGLQFECANTATLNGTGNAIDVQNSTEGFISYVKCQNTNGFVTIGNTTNTTQSSRLKIDHCQINAYAPAGGISVDVQNQSGTKISFVNFAGIGGTAPSSFRGVKVHPAAADTADTMKCIHCEWNYNGPDPLYNVEYDCTNNSIGNQVFVGCVFDQAVTGANIYVHCDASPGNGALFAGLFLGCISNGSTDARCILIENTGQKPISFHWTGGQLTSGNSGYLGEISPGAENLTNLTVTGSYFKNRSATAGEAAFVVADGGGGLTLIGNTVVEQHNPSTGLFIGSYDYLVNFEGDAEGCTITNNDAAICEIGLIKKTSSLVSSNIIRDNVCPGGSIPDTAASDKVTFFDDFLAAAIDGRISSTAGAGTGNQAATTVSSGLSGEITLKSASDDGTHAQNGSTITLDQLNFKANQGGLAMETRLKVDNIASVAIFVGFTDVISTTVELPIYKTSGADTIDSDATDACGIAFDTDGTTDQWFVGGVANGTDTAATHSGSAPVNDTYVVLRVEVSAAGAVTGYIDGVPVDSVASAVTTTVALTPAIIVANRSASQRTLTIDYIWAQQDRA